MEGKIFGNFIDDAEKAMFLEAAQKTIVQQSKKITELETEVAHLKALLAKSAPLIDVPKDNVERLPGEDEKSIARLELAKLRQASEVRELTMEEARKVEIYAKLLHQLNNAPKKLVIDTKKIPSTQLLGSLDEAANDDNT